MANIGFGLWMTAMGMGTVFSMLALLMGVLALMGRLDRTKAPAETVILTQSGSPSSTEGMTTEGMPVDDAGDPDCVRMTTEDVKTTTRDGRMTTRDVRMTSGTETGMTPEGPTPELLAAITTAVLTHVRVRRGQAAPEMREVQPGSHLFASRWVAVGRAYQNKPWK